ncbi:hypothetical protein [Shinella zoogloeoides]|uniref:Uncharacterized protein n=1 Tax=Shinella zoogloeoides TaxID=352475 RepID=A0A6N8TNV3_SHIZO|nr:hypothetical protein [Shinella zoogloeoides]MXO02834.1 hypothetical protein [Shinella zoogloeoides]UEX84517.1 hypothetical protein K8M09_23545 [Shinella zoogloeoides]
MSGGSGSERDEERTLTKRLQDLQAQMNRLEVEDDMYLKRAYDDPAEAEERMVAYRDDNGEDALFVALRERPELFGDYPRDKARFDDAYQARKQLPVTFANYRRLRDDSDILQVQLQRLQREREDDLHPER